MTTREPSQEQRVETMIAEGRKILSDAIARYRPVAIVAAYSGGDDSIVSTHFAMTERADGFAFNADTLIGLRPTRDHIEGTCKRFNWELEVGKATATGAPARMKSGGKLVPFDAGTLAGGEWRDGETAYEEATLNFGFPGRGKIQHSWMYRKLKERPIRRLLRRFGAGKPENKPKVLLVSGIRHDESVIRAGYKDVCRAGDSGDVWLSPFHWRTAADFAAYRDEFGLPGNPVKRTCGISGECCCETFPNVKAGRSAYEIADPEFGRYVDALESRVMEVFPWGYGESPPRWWVDARKGQTFMFDVGQGASFQPMCVGCARGK